MSSLLKAYLPQLNNLTGALQTGGVVQGLTLREESGIYLFQDVAELSSFQEVHQTRENEVNGSGTDEWISRQVFTWWQNPATEDRWFFDAYLAGYNDDDFFTDSIAAGESTWYLQFVDIQQYRDHDSSSGFPIMKFDLSNMITIDPAGLANATYIIPGERIGGWSGSPLRCANGISYVQLQYYDPAAAAAESFSLLTRWVDAPPGVIPASVR